MATLRATPAASINRKCPVGSCPTQNARSCCKPPSAKVMVMCTMPLGDRARKVAQTVASVTAALLMCSTTSQAASLEKKSCKLTYVSSDSVVMNSDSATETNPPITMTGMTAKNFDPARYAGRWFEVASLKLGFSGVGQDDCHCTQGVYEFDEANRAIQVETFCAHGSPDGYITGIKGKVQCVINNEPGNDIDKCFLRFPTLPFIPKQPYDVLATDYDNYALVSGAKGTSFVQIYSRTPNPGAEFIDMYRAYLGELGYNAGAIKDTPQDCEVTSMSELSAMMASLGMEQAVTNTIPGLSLTKPVQFNPLTSLFDTFKKLVKLYFS